MAFLWLAVTLFILTLLESTVLQVFSPDAWGVSLQMIPRFVLVGVVYIALYSGRRQGLWYGLAFGLLQDLLYSDVLGVYAFGMAVVGYFSGLAFKLFHQSLLLVSLTMILSVLVYELIVFSFFSLFSIANVDFYWMLMKQLLPTLFLNVSFGMLIYRPMATLLEGVRKEQEDGER